MLTINDLVLFEFSESEPPSVILPTLPFVYSGKVDGKSIFNNSKGYKIEIPIGLTSGRDISSWENEPNPIEIDRNQNWTPIDLAKTGSDALKNLHDSIKLYHLKNK